MQALVVREFGGPEVMRLEELPLPSPGDDEALVRIHAASINPVDLKIRAGEFPMIGADKLPLVPGRDFAGTVEYCGRDVRSFTLGHAVYGMVDWDRGTYADYVIVSESEAVAKPRALATVTAAAVPLAGLTAWQGLIEHGGLAEAERVLIHGGAGGVGHLAVQIAKARGAVVLTTASPRDQRFLTDLGADEVLDYHDDGYPARVGKVDLVLDLIGGETLDRSWGMLDRGGRLISTLDEPSSERAQEAGVRAMRFLVRSDLPQLTQLSVMIDSGELRPHVERVFTMTEAAEAHRFLVDEHVRGKIVLQTATTATGGGG